MDYYGSMCAVFACWLCVNYVIICVYDILTRIGMKMAFHISYARGHRRILGVSA